MTVAPEDRVLDWAPHHDPRSLAFPARTLFKRTTVVNWSWRTPVVPLDQGAEGACVGFGWTHEALTTPVVVDLSRIAAESWRKAPDLFARSVYRAAQFVDEWDGQAYEGTSVNAGAKIMRDIGLIKEWRWAFGVDDVIMSIINVGPVVLGINWYSGMYHAPGGILSVGGQLVGGHCIIARAVRQAGVIFADEEAIGIFNSWGPTYGTNGSAWVRKSELARLLSENAEAAVPVRRSFGR